MIVYKSPELGRDQVWPWHPCIIMHILPITLPIRSLRDHVQSSMSIKKEIIDQLCQTPLLLKGNLKCLSRFDEGSRPTLGQRFPFFLDIELCTRSLSCLQSHTTSSNNRMQCMQCNILAKLVVLRLRVSVHNYITPPVKNMCASKGLTTPTKTDTAPHNMKVVLIYEVHLDIYRRLTLPVYAAQNL